MTDQVSKDLLPYYNTKTPPEFTILLRQQFDHNAMFHFAKNLGLFYNIHLTEMSDATCMALQPNIRDDFKTILTKVDVIYYLLRLYRLYGLDWYTQSMTKDVTQFWKCVAEEKNILSNHN